MFFNWIKRVKTIIVTVIIYLKKRFNLTMKNKKEQLNNCSIRLNLNVLCVFE